MITTGCLACGKRIEAPYTAAGGRVGCPNCGAAVVVPPSPPPPRGFDPLTVLGRGPTPAELEPLTESQRGARTEDPSHNSAQPPPAPPSRQNCGLLRSRLQRVRSKTVVALLLFVACLAAIVGSWESGDAVPGDRQSSIPRTDDALATANDVRMGWSLVQVTDSWSPENGWAVKRLSRLDEREGEIICVLKYNDELGMMAAGQADDLNGVAVIVSSDAGRESQSLALAAVERLLGASSHEIVDWMRRAAADLDSGHTVQPLRSGRLQLDATFLDGQLWYIVYPQALDFDRRPLMGAVS